MVCLVATLTRRIDWRARFVRCRLAFAAPARSENRGREPCHAADNKPRHQRGFEHGGARHNKQSPIVISRFNAHTDWLRGQGPTTPSFAQNQDGNTTAMIVGWPAARDGREHRPAKFSIGQKSAIAKGCGHTEED